MTGVPTVPLAGGAGAIPIVGLGTWQLRGDEAYDAVRSALDAGYRHLDTATIYENEREIGRAMRDSGVPRDEIFLTTKLPPANAGKERETLEGSLEALAVDRVDLWLIHWPPDDEGAPAVWAELLRLQQEGLARAVGVSNYRPEQIDRLIETSGVAPALNQIKWSPLLYDAGRLQHSRDRGVVLEGYSPFRAGDLGDPVLGEIAERHGVTPAQVVLRWHVDTGVVVIPKSARPERIRANLDVFGFALTDDEVSQVSRTTR